MSLLEVAIATTVVLGTSLLLWNAVTFYYTIPHRDISGSEMFRKAGYRYLDFKRAIVGALTVITFLAAPTDHANNDVPTLLITSGLLYSVFSTMCYLSGIKAAKAYIAQVRGAGSVTTHG